MRKPRSIDEFTPDNRDRKLELELKRLIHCGICAYHRVENYGRRPLKSWKEYRKKQFRANNPDK